VSRRPVSPIVGRDELLVDAEFAELVVRVIGAFYRASAARGGGAPTGADEVVRELRGALDQAAAISVGGSRLPPAAVREPASAASWRWPTTQQAAERLAVSKRRVIQLIDEGRLVAVKDAGGAWHIDPASLDVAVGDAR